MQSKVTVRSIGTVAMPPMENSGELKETMVCDIVETTLMLLDMLTLGSKILASSFNSTCTRTRAVFVILLMLLMYTDTFFELRFDVWGGTT